MKTLRIILFSLLGIIIFIVGLSSLKEKSVRWKLRKYAKKERNYQLSAISEDNSFTFTTYNIWGLPFWMPGMEKRKRFTHLPDSLLRLDVDVICLQETFDEKIRLYLTPILEKHYQHQNDYTCNRKVFGPIKNDCNGGLMTFSKYPILWQGFYANPLSDELKMDEKKGRKGYLISRIDTEIGELIIVNLHLYAGGTAADEAERLNQVKYFERLLQELNINHLPLIVLGDLNCRHPSIARQRKLPFSDAYAYLTDSLYFKDTVSELDPTGCTYNYITNKYVSSFMYAGNGEIEKLDYCLYRLPENYRLTLEHDEVIFNGENTFSDHYGYTTRLKIEKEDVMTDQAP